MRPERINHSQELSEGNESLAEVTFSPIDEEDISTIMDIEEELYPDPSLEEEDLEDMIDDPSFDLYSFLIHVDGREDPVGYCMATEQDEPEHFDLEPGKKSIYLEDIGIIREGRQGGETSRKAFTEFMSRVKRGGVDLVEMEARAETSYKLLVGKDGKGGAWQEIAKKYGYSVVRDESDVYTDESGTYYWVGLRRSEELDEGDDEAMRGSNKTGRRVFDLFGRLKEK